MKPRVCIPQDTPEISHELRQYHRLRPLFIYDGECGFCTMWVSYWQRLTGERVHYAPFQEAADQYPEILLSEFERAAQFVDRDGNVSSGAEAVFRVLAEVPGKRQWIRLYERFPFFARLCEGVYRIISNRRGMAFLVSRFLWGRRVLSEEHQIVRWLFVRLLGIIYFTAFVSLFFQVRGLWGARGILSIAEWLGEVGMNFGLGRLWVAPTLFWLNASDGFLQFLAGAGVFFALLVTIGLWTRLSLIFLWFFYLSFVAAGQDFMTFQWDALLLEVGFLAILLVPGKRWESHWGLLKSIFSSVSPATPRITVWLFRWLLFRLMFFSGAFKLASGDPVWRNLTALSFHYETQPLPTPVAWFVHQLPLWFQKLSAAGTFGVELVAPFLIFLPRRMRLLAAGTFALLQISILATGNYAFFNILTLALCLFLLDDEAVSRVLPRALAGHIVRGVSAAIIPPARPARVSSNGARRRVLAVIALGIVFLGALQVGVAMRILSPLFAPLAYALAPLRVVNSYGLFAVMTTTRDEIIVEGSEDGKTWQAYGLKYKPGDEKRAPPIVAPHQPRLDWQMWFAALGNYQQSPWFLRFAARLLEGSPEVLALLQENPFPSQPPRFIRAVRYEYHFTNSEERHASGKWWKRMEKGLYLPPVSLR